MPKQCQIHIAPFGNAPDRLYLNAGRIQARVEACIAFSWADAITHLLRLKVLRFGKAEMYQSAGASVSFQQIRLIISL